jgi:hypothetical protein
VSRELRACRQDGGERRLHVRVGVGDNRAVILLEEVLVLVGETLEGRSSRVEPGLARCSGVLLTGCVVGIPVTLDAGRNLVRGAAKASSLEQVGAVADCLGAGVGSESDFLAVDGSACGLEVVEAALVVIGREVDEQVRVLLDLGIQSPSTASTSLRPEPAASFVKRLVCASSDVFATTCLIVTFGCNAV